MEDTDERVQELIERSHQFDHAAEQARRLVDGVTTEQFNRRPEPDRWSMAECLDHLTTTGHALIPPLEAGIERAREKGWFSQGPFRYGRLGNWVVRTIGADELPPRRRLPAPRLYRPPPGPDRSIEAALTDFVALQDDLKALVTRAEGIDLARVKIRSPVLWLLRLSLGQWFALIVGHQKRHLWQAGQVKREVVSDRV